MSIGRADSGKVDKKAIDAAEKAIMAEVTIDRTHDVPYCCGYSKAWGKGKKTLFFDPMVPRTFKLSTGPCDVTRYAAIHEAVEKTLMEVLGLPYEPAHAFATASEEAAVKADGHDVAEYNKLWDRAITKIGERRHYEEISPEMDLEPYTDEGDKKLEARMGLLGH